MVNIMVNQRYIALRIIGPSKKEARGLTLHVFRRLLGSPVPTSDLRSHGSEGGENTIFFHVWS